MANVIYDKKHDFGTVSSPATGAFPNILNLGETDAERMTVDIHSNGLTGGTSLTFAIQGSATEGGTYTAIATGAAVLTADLNAGVYQLPVPETKFKFLKAAITASGTFTAGSVQAILNTYVGK
ncbi:MAG: hypothetical protein LBB77_04775 [Treponema sp.]|jgi:hypothetical protein|nr:hypothetical protein [Treponema sp.]